MNNLTDPELIDHTLKFSLDPVQVRLAKIMDNTQGHLLDGLEYAGMDRETWLFDNTYDPGQYITHLKSEVDYLQDELNKAYAKIDDMKTKTVLELIDELKHTNEVWKAEAARYERARDQAFKDRDEMKHKMDMWAILNR